MDTLKAEAPAKRKKWRRKDWIKRGWAVLCLLVLFSMLASTFAMRY